MIVVYLIENPKQYLEITNSLKMICEELGFSYSTLSKKQYPFEWRGYYFQDKEPKTYTRTNK